MSNLELALEEDMESSYPGEEEIEDMELPEQEFSGEEEIEDMELPEQEFPGEGESEEIALEIDGDDKVEKFANRLYELSRTSYESEFDENLALNEIETQMQYEFFWGPAKKYLRKKLGKGFRALINKGLKLAPSVLGKVPGYGDIAKGVTALTRGDFKGLASTLAKAGLKAGIQAALPGAGTAAVSAMNALGFEIDQPEANKDAWRKYVMLNRDGYGYLARNLNEHADEPAEAARLATEAFEYAIEKQGLPSKRSQYKRRRKFISVGSGKRVGILLGQDSTLVVKSRRRAY